MSIYEIPTHSGYDRVNSAWTTDFKAAMATLEQGRGSGLGYDEKQGYWLALQSATGMFTVIAAANGATLTSVSLQGVIVTAIGIEGGIYPASDGATAYWRKGAADDDADERKASDTITLLDSSVFAIGQTVIIFKSQS